jgi:hypothetical protein
LSFQLVVSDYCISDTNLNDDLDKILLSVLFSGFRCAFPAIL